MQYQVPQFIEIEDKIFGPLTIKQFLYLAGAGGLSLILFTLLPLWLSIPLMIPVVVFGLLLAFYKVNDRPFIVTLEHGVKYLLGSKLYLWKQREAKPTPKAPVPTVATSQLVPRLSNSKLKDIAWSLNIKDRGQANPPRRDGLAI